MARKGRNMKRNAGKSRHSRNSAPRRSGGSGYSRPASRPGHGRRSYPTGGSYIA